jgi:hypothetical protein
MTEIVLTSDQSEQFAKATDGVVLCDAAGNVVARIPPKTTDEEAEIVAEAKQRLASDQPRIPSSDVVARLKRLNAQAKQ